MNTDNQAGVWVRGNERLPGLGKIVKWRNADGGNIPLGENDIISQYNKVGPNVSWHEWYDEGGQYETGYKNYDKMIPKCQMIANVIQLSLNDKGLSRMDFSKLMDVQPSVITRWLSGNHNFTIDTIVAIENELSITIINPQPSSEQRGEGEAINIEKLYISFMTESETRMIKRRPIWSRTHECIIASTSVIDVLIEQVLPLVKTLDDLNKLIALYKERRPAV